jgi:uncharacterized membrane protein YbhN (UPF0104 family)
LDTILNESDIVSNLLLSSLIIVVFITLLLFLANERLTLFLIQALNKIASFAQRKVISDEEDTASVVSREISNLIRNRRVLLLGSGASIFIWFLEGVVFWIVTLSMDLNVSLGMAFFVLLTSGLIGNSLTSASGLSQLPFMVVQLVLLEGISQEVALSTSIVYLFIVFWIIIPIGFFLHELDKFKNVDVSINGVR